MSIVSQNKWLIGAASAALIASATLWEGVRYEPYYDVGGIPTVCMGYTGKDVVWGKRYSPQECNNLLRKELTEHGKGVLNCTKEKLSVNEYNAYTLFAYNVGVNAFCTSRANRLLNEGKHAEACNALAYSPTGSPAWSYAGGKFYKGLHNRRLYERSMCLGDGDVYKG